MDTSKIESLLQQLLDKHDELIARIECLEATVDQLMSEANRGVSEVVTTVSAINDELNWWGEGHSLAKQVLSALDAINCSVMTKP